MTDPIAPLSARFRERMRSDHAALLTLAQGDPAAPDLRRLIHGVAGAAGIFGFPELSRLAVTIDDLYAEGGRPDRGTLKDLAEAIRGIIDDPS